MSSLQSNCEKHFILKSIQERKRLDGREVHDFRTIDISIHDEPGCVEVTLGGTRVLCCVSCSVVEPSANRPTEGQLHFNVELSPMASLQFEPGRPSNMATEIEQILERCYKQSRAVDRESLCIVAGEKVWEVRVDCHVLDYCGNIVDCCSIAAITALKHFKRPDVTVIGNEATVHSVLEKNPVPLSVHHMPVCVTFGFFTDHTYLLVDPTHREEQVMKGKLIVGMNSHREVCVLQLVGGVAVLPDQIYRCTQIANVKAKDILKKINEVLEQTLQDEKGIIPLETRPKTIKSTLDHGEEMKIEVDHSPLRVEGNKKKTQPSVRELVPNVAYEMGVGGSNMWDLPTVEMEGSDLEGDHKMDSHDGVSQVKDLDSEEEETVVLTSVNLDYQTRDISKPESLAVQKVEGEDTTPRVTADSVVQTNKAKPNRKKKKRRT